MTTLFVEHMQTHTDDLGRFITTLTQEITVSVNSYEEKIFVDTLMQVDEQEGCIEYHNEDYSQLEVSGYGVNKAIKVINDIAGHTLLAPVTTIENNELYKVEFLY